MAPDLKTSDLDLEEYSTEIWNNLTSGDVRQLPPGVPYLNWSVLGK